MTACAHFNGFKLLSLCLRIATATIDRDTAIAWLDRYYAEAITAGAISVSY